MSGRDELYCTDRITDPNRKAELERFERYGFCQFCADGIARGYTRVKEQGTHWYIVENSRPYPGTIAHSMAVSKVHVLDLDNLDLGVGDELLALFSSFMKENGQAGASMVMRFGTMQKTCASVAHTHVHFVAAGEGVLGDKTFQIDLGYWPKG